VRAPRRSDHRVVRQVASRVLEYPTDGLLGEVPLMRSALAECRGCRGVDDLGPLLDHLAARRLDALQRDYVEVFDLSRKRALHLSYWTDGDTRRRGEVLGRFKTAYRASGVLVSLHGELPDHLPVVLEFAALVDPEAGTALLQEYRASLELIRLALLELGTPYAGALAAVCATLPGESPADRGAAMAMAGAGPPTESVGLEPFDPRLLPVHPETAR
jgi:nitrate reductase delta subunit